VDAHLSLHNANGNNPTSLTEGKNIFN